MPRRLTAALLAFPLFLTGCYTQLYTRGYAERAASNYPDYARGPAAQADTALQPDSGATVAAPGESASVARTDREEPAGTVIVNNYYRESPYYRGYLLDTWDYPALTFGIYSSRYRDYCDPFWRNDPWYGRNGYRSGYGRDYGGYGGYRPPSPGGGNPGPYKSDKRVFSTDPDRPDHPVLHKGRRSGSGSEPAAPAPKSSGEVSGSTSSPSGSPSSSTSSSTGSGSQSGSSGSSSDSSEKEDHPSLNKGRRR